METAIFSPQILGYLEALPESSMTMEALNLALNDGKSIKVLIYDKFWYHLAIPKDLERYHDYIKEIRKIQFILGVKGGKK